MEIKVSKRGFFCGYCNKKRKGAYIITSDNERSCEKCNRAYDYIPQVKKVSCPVCKGVGYFEEQYS